MLQNTMTNFFVYTFFQELRSRRNQNKYKTTG